MRFKFLYIVIFLLITAFHGWSQDDDIVRKRRDEVSLSVDPDVNPGNTQAEQEKAKKDSIDQVNRKWKNYLSEKNTVIRQIYDSVQQIDKKTGKEKTEEYKIKVTGLKRQVETKIQNDGSWKYNDDLDDLYFCFLETCDLALLKLIDDPPPPPVNIFIIIGICLGAIMLGIPMFFQMKAGRSMKKIKKQQEEQAKKQAEEEERQRLLESEENIII